MTLRPAPSFEARLLIWVMSWLVPAGRRRTWREEWYSEVWHAEDAMLQRADSPRSMRLQLRQFSRGCVADALWYHSFDFSREELLRQARRRSRSAGFCLATLVSGIVGLGILSGGFPVTRAVLAPLPYSTADRVATVSQGGMSLAVRSAIPMEWVRLWQRQSRLLEGVATYRWRRDREGLQYAEVDDKFFALLGAAAASGRLFHAGDERECADCVVVSHAFWQKHGGGGRPGGQSRVMLNHRSYRVLGVLDRRFWFLSRSIGAWTLATPALKARTGVVIRLGADVTPQAARAEMERLVQEAGFSRWDSLVDISLLRQRVLSVFDSFALGLALAVVIALSGLGLYLPGRAEWGWRAVLFFGSKTALLLSAVLLAGLEFTSASSINMLGGTDISTEPLSTWLFLLGCMGALSWSILEQRRRCRVCLRRLGMAAHVGCPGCLLLDWAGTELVCIEGHGLLHVPDLQASWRPAEQWTALDESWTHLFAAE